MKRKLIKSSLSGSEIISYIRNRLREPSTWRGIIWLLTASGYVLTIEQSNAIITLGMALAGLIGVFTRDNTSKTN